MDYASTLETLEGLLNALARHCARHVGAWEIVYTLFQVRVFQKLLVVVNKAPRRLLHSTSILKRVI